MTIEEFHSDIRRALNEGQGRYWTPIDIDASINKAVRDHYKSEYRIFEETQEITDTLGFFKAMEEKTVGAGIITLPDTFNHITELQAVMTDGSKKPLTLVRDSEWSRKVSSPGFPPEPDYPVGRQYNNKIEVLPVIGSNKVEKVRVYFIRKPVNAKYNFTEAANNYGFVYVDSGSVQVDWPDIDHNRISLKAQSYLGIPMHDQVAIQSEQIKIPSGA